jgi:BirA family transcriptional regulator, biotin operon repressor / biotin---[acetyl-CoA-carboxylase] ligase
MIEERDIRQSLRTQFLGRRIYSFDSIDSTNTFARSLKEEDCPNGTLVVADEQTAGKGRQGRQWQSQKGMNLLFTLVTRPLFVHEKIRVLPFAAALAAADGIEQETKSAIECKWPNDLLIDGKKVAGMLIETTAQDDAVMNVILGIGINVNQTDFPDDIKNKATSLKLHAQQDVDRVRLLCAVLQELEYRFDQLRHFSAQILLDEWKQRATMLGAEITLVEHRTAIKAKAMDVAPDGALIIEEANGTRRHVFAGDVTIGE